MILPIDLQTAWQQQLTLERTNAAYYDALAAQAQNIALDGTAEWMRKAANDERSHAQKVIDFLVSRRVMPLMDALPTAPAGMTSISDFFTAAMARENITTAAIDNLYDLAESESDPMSCVYLHWFIEEQRASEAEIFDILQRLSRAVDMYLFDKELNES